MPSATAAFAIFPPIAPRPITPSVLPNISGPANLDLPPSTVLGASGVPLSEAAHAAASVIFLEARRSAQIASSLTAFEFAPGVLNTTIPCSAHFSTGILFTPAPALAIASRLSGISISCIFAERTIIAVGFSALSLTVYLALSKISVPQVAILFRVKTLYISITSFKWFTRSL